MPEQIYKQNNLPDLLAQIAQPPTDLFVRGQWNHRLFKKTVAIVGSRKPTLYGKRAVNDIAGALAANGFTIISGLALGIDSLAHQAALDAGGKTVAVLAGGLDDDSIYPRSHLSLAKNIIRQKGLLLSEHSPGTQVQKWHFVARNRIIAGLARATVVIQAAAKSGSLITAYSALEENREVITIPGVIYDKAFAGNNKLLQLGAWPLIKAEEIAKILNIEWQTKLDAAVELEPTEQLIFNALKQEACHVDDLKKELKLDIIAITSTLSIMEIKGLVTNLGNMTYALSQK